MSDGLHDVIALAEDLDVAARRRLWLVTRIIECRGLSEIESALAIAAKVEVFIVNGYISGGVAPDRREAAPSSEATRTAAQISSAPPALGPQIGVGIGAKCHHARRPLLDEETRIRFIHEAVRNSNNRHLAQIFGLSTRQAHAIRVGLSKFISQAQHEVGAGACNHDGRGAPIDRETELKMQEDFLRSRPPAPHTTDDVVRYLRQAGDVVVSNGQRYIVNYRLTLTSEQLIERANTKRRERRQVPFIVEPVMHAESDVG